MIPWGGPRPVQKFRPCIFPSPCSRRAGLVCSRFNSDPFHLANFKPCMQVSMQLMSNRRAHNWQLFWKRASHERERNLSGTLNMSWCFWYADVQTDEQHQVQKNRNEKSLWILSEILDLRALYTLRISYLRASVSAWGGTSGASGYGICCADLVTPAGDPWDSWRIKKGVKLEA